MRMLPCVCVPARTRVHVCARARAWHDIQHCGRDLAVEVRHDLGVLVRLEKIAGHVLVQCRLSVENIDTAAGLGPVVIDEILVPEALHARPVRCGTPLSQQYPQVVEVLHIRVL